jgi:Mn2+/Fe2+ NRAMP family transporter
MLYGISKWITVPLVALILISISLAGKYKRVEKIAIFVGIFEVVFIPAAIYAKPDYGLMLKELVGSQPLNNSSYLLLVAANVGAVIMPWMIFYQQGAVIDKGLSKDSIKFSRIDTFFGSIVTQIVMGAVLVLTAATLGKMNHYTPLENIQQIANALTPFLGSFVGKVLFAIGLTGSALIAAIVVSLATSWAFSEVLDVKGSLNNKWIEAPVFYGIYCGGIIVAAILVLIGIPLVSLTVAVEVMNSLLLPIVLGFLLALGWKVLPKEYKLKKWEKAILIFIYVLVCSLGLFTIFQLF